MNFEGNFKKLGTIDTTQVRALIETESDAEWAIEDATRERYPGPLRRDIQTIAMLFDWGGETQPLTRCRRHSAYAALLEPIFQQIASGVGGGVIRRCLFVRLRPNGLILPHVDEGHEVSHRIHVPILTNDQVFFTVDGERLHMRPGEIWEINNSRLHYVENRGAEERVHLVLNWHPRTSNDRRAA